MTARFFILLALMCVLWQALGGLNSSAIVKQSADITHGVIHSQGAHHHHHEDLSLHTDESDVHVAHHHTDAGASLPVILPTPNLFAVTNQASIPIPARFSAHTSPDAEGPLRPPRAG